VRHTTAEGFVDRLDSEFAWRQKELTSLLTEAVTASPALQPLRLRAAVALLYAHWEGFVKTAADLYVDYVASKRLLDCDLNDGLRVLALRPRMRKTCEGGNVAAMSALVAYMSKGLPGRARVPKDSFSKRIANLTASDFKRIVHLLGLDSTLYDSLNDSLVDIDLLECRNHIAHGQHRCPHPEDYPQLHEDVVRVLRTFKDQLENAAVLGTYRRP
jgi:hypothetical protein